MAIGAVWGEIWGDIWDTAIWSQDITVSLGAQKKRKGGGRAQRKRFVVEVDGQFVQVSTISEAQAVLAQARELAQESARRDVRPKVRIKPPRVAVRTVNGTIPTSPVINREAKRTQEFINRAYRDAQTSLERDLEIALLMRKAMQEEDDEEAVLALML